MSKDIRTINVFNKEYSFDDLSDLERDISEAIEDSNSKVDVDQHGVFNGCYKVTIEYIEEVEQETKMCTFCNGTGIGVRSITCCNCNGEGYYFE